MMLSHTLDGYECKNMLMHNAHVEHNHIRRHTYAPTH